MKDFRDLKVWAKAHEVALACYAVTKGASVPANIAEGCGRRGNAELHRFLQMAMGSASELEYHLLLSRDLGYLNKDDHKRVHDQVEEVKRMLASLTRKVDLDRNV
jgi:four helix bundle protein